MTVLLRPEVREFADEMERELRRHDPKKGDSWKTMDPQDLKVDLCDVYSKWRMGIVKVYCTPEEQIRDELVDLANVAMMLWHRLKEG